MNKPLRHTVTLPGVAGTHAAGAARPPAAVGTGRPTRLHPGALP
ncbi:hypothetical protein GCM10010441_02060 [Kitasatospora paracochleata]|uniref:Uncharacterized protein n=1 Tax=Kitasatospora paracochleata TaxID=58354 RepID=A0ABT1J351_9ACTN|nr:hypothetical protein [Kitasatospora paracochleata]MCP2311674.1 hypothetical protein [Kitasatospora paracochleata]